MAEIALGVIPLIGTAFTTYRTLHSHLRAFRHYAKDLERTTKKLGIQRDRFKLECWLLLRSALDENRIRQLKGDTDQSYWNDPAVNAEFERNFKSSYRSCFSIIEDISGCLKELEEELQEFNPLIKDKDEGESLSDSVRRFRKRVHVTVNRRKYEDICKELKESNNDLKDLSEKIEKLQQPCSRSHQRCLVENRRNRGDWGAACKARRASAALYEGLQQSFSCKNAPHGHHSMRLFLDVPKPSSLSTMALTMRMALSVVGRSAQAHTVPTAFHLRVDSRDMQWVGEDPLTPPHTQLRYNDTERSSKRVKRIEPSQPSVSSTVTASPITSNAAFTREPEETCEQAARDLACILDLCSHFGQHCLCPAQQMPQYIGYLDVQDHVRHDFYRSYGRVQTDENVPLSALLSSFDPRDLNMPQRLKLAKTVAATALTYFDTPWMKDMWRLRDISLLSASTQDPSVLLNTLHLEVDLMSRKQLIPPSGDASLMDMALTPQSASNLSDDDLLDKGIFNKSLHSLGVALVGIETAQDLDPANWDDVRNVRKYARGSIFGDKYKAVIEKCFAFNCDLSRPKSHRQAFESIVGSLEDMISSLDLDEGDWS